MAGDSGFGCCALVQLEQNSMFYYMLHLAVWDAPRTTGFRISKIRVLYGKRILDQTLPAPDPSNTIPIPSANPNANVLRGVNWKPVL